MGTSGTSSTMSTGQAVSTGCAGCAGCAGQAMGTGGASGPGGTRASVLVASGATTISVAVHAYDVVSYVLITPYILFTYGGRQRSLDGSCEVQRLLPDHFRRSRRQCFRQSGHLGLSQFGDRPCWLGLRNGAGGCLACSGTGVGVVVTGSVCVRAADSRARCSTVVSIAVDSGVCGIANSAGVRSMGTLGSAVLSATSVARVMAGDGVLDFVDNTRHVGKL